MFKAIIHELEHHTPFTIFGAVTGVALMFLAQGLPSSVSLNLFYIMHPAHVFFSAVVTASMYQLHKCKSGEHHCNPWNLIVIGYVGSIGLATLSDSVIPYIGERLLQMPYSEPHIGFIDRWWIVNPIAFVALAVAYFWPQTKIPHALHVLVSTWASLFHMMSAVGDHFSWGVALGVFGFLFLAVWLPCCVSDIVFPLLFVKSSK